MLCLGIESSCDETGLALVDNGLVVSSCLASQVPVHAVFGGVVPEIASREHLRVLPGLWADLFRNCDRSPQDIRLVAVTRGPGLLGSLLVGLGFAKGVAMGLSVPLIGVDHLLAHLMVSGMASPLEFPFLGLVVSGGHTSIYRSESSTSFTVLGRTLDDAAGEAFDKTAKCLNLPYPGGRLIDEMAVLAEPDRKMLPRPYLDNQNLDFSFSGLKTATANLIASRPEFVQRHMSTEGTLASLTIHPDLPEFCASFNWAVADTIRIKIERALARYPDTRMLVVAGGVAANSAVRAIAGQLSQVHGISLAIPDVGLCSDNGVMIAYYGEILGRAGFFHGQDLDAVPRGRKVPWDYRSI
ncbi:MAG: tRNA (adenosine(37)-N6)-threonylcarbamoyltransferase complex transferase subunit TsaD [Deltaproteobacteria bacterium]|nr:tRNA (adenosine(37)-N6)-threonylcarbamoyltransferase complex transferase subunit TsaD [Deltaproteobacteria bacterium]